MTTQDELNKLIEDFIAKRDQRRQMEDIAKRLKLQEDSLEQNLWLHLEAAGIKSVKTEKYGLIIRTFNHTPYVVDFPMFREWAAQTENYELIREDVKRQQLRDFISSRLKAGQSDAIPPGIEYQINKKIQIKGRPDSEED